MGDIDSCVNGVVEWSGVALDVNWKADSSVLNWQNYWCIERYQKAERMSIQLFS